MPSRTRPGCSFSTACLLTSRRQNITRCFAATQGGHYRTMSSALPFLLSHLPKMITDLRPDEVVSRLRAEIDRFRRLSLRSADNLRCYRARR